MYEITYSNQFKKDLKRLMRSGRFKIEKFNFVVNTLAKGKRLPPNLEDHALSGKMANSRECHITPDLLLIYKIIDEVMVLYMVRIGSHSELF